MSSKAKKVLTTNGEEHRKSTLRSVCSRLRRPLLRSITFIAKISRVCRLRTSHTVACEPRCISRTISKSCRHGAWPCESGSDVGMCTMVCCSSPAHEEACSSAVILRCPAARMSAQIAAVDGCTEAATRRSSCAKQVSDHLS